MWTLNVAEWANTSVLPAGAVSIDVVEILPKSAYRYSAFSDQCACREYSAPPPTVQPTLVSDIDWRASAGLNVSVNSSSYLNLVTAAPAVAKTKVLSSTTTARGRSVASQSVLTCCDSEKVLAGELL